MNVYIKDGVNNYTLISVPKTISLDTAKENIRAAFNCGISVTGAAGEEIFYPPHMIHHITVEDDK